MEKPFAFRELTNTKAERFDEGFPRSHMGKVQIKTMDLNSECKTGMYGRHLDKSAMNGEKSKTQWPDKEKAGLAYNPLGIDVS